MNYSEAIQRLEQITKLLSTNIGFDDAVALFNEGVELIKQCNEVLVERKGKLIELNQTLDGIISQTELD